MVDLSKIGQREALKPQKGDEPHWQRLRAGCYLGFRPSKRGGKGTWFARAYDLDKEKYSRKALGDYGSLSGHDVFTQAKRDAENWADKVESGGVQLVKLETVADACRAYLTNKPGAIAEGVFRRHVYDDPIAKVKLDKLRRHHLKEWRKRLEDTPALVSRNKKGTKRTKQRSTSTINRDMVPVRAALGHVLVPGAPNTDAEAAPFVRALCLLPLRPGAVANLRVGDFDKRTRTLTIGKDKNGRPRQITLPVTAADFLEMPR